MPGKGNPSKLKPFKKGDPRINRKGRPKRLPELDTLLAECVSKAEQIEMINGLKERAMAFATTKSPTDLRALELFWNRGYGTAMQRVEIESDQTINLVPDETGLIPPPASRSAQRNGVGKEV